MSIATTTPTTSSTSSASSSPTTITSQADYNTAYTQFLKMLTTELQNQDPTSPMDTTQFTNQLVGFSQLEQQLQTNSKLDTLVTDQSSSSLGNALSYLGHTVTATGSSFSLDGTNPSTIAYSLPSTASAATLTVKDSSGNTVRTEAIPTASGTHSMSFTGTEDGGSVLPAGTYSFSIAATSASGTAIAATTYISGQVTGVDTSSGAAVLDIGAQTVNASNVTNVSA